MVYGYTPGSWAGVVGSFLIITPLICIPVFFFISLCKVRAAIRISIAAKIGVTVSLKLILVPRILKPWPLRPVTCARLDRTSRFSRCAGTSSSGRRRSPIGGTMHSTRSMRRRQEHCEEFFVVTHWTRKILLYFCPCWYNFADDVKWKKGRFGHAEMKMLKFWSFIPNKLEGLQWALCAFFGGTRVQS